MEGKQNPSAYAKTGFKLKFRRGELNETDAPKGVENLLCFCPVLTDKIRCFNRESDVP